MANLESDIFIYTNIQHYCRGKQEQAITTLN